MRIEINKDWCIDFDGTSYMPTKKTIITAKDSKRIGEESEQIKGYFNQLGNAVDKIIKTDLGNREEALTLQQYVSEYKQSKEQLLQTLNN